MDEHGAQLEARQGGLAERLRVLEARVTALEAATAPAAARPGGASPAGEAVPASPGGPAASLPGLLALAGRCFLVLGGAFLVRALTDAGALPRGAGVALGLVYASVWLALCDRSGRAGHAVAATAYGLTATAIVCPLVWEATTRLGVFSPAAAAAVLLGLGLTSLTISSRRALAGLAWAAALGIVATGFALLIATRSLITFGLVLLLLAAASLVVSLRKGWAGLPWPAALSADLVVLQGAWIAGRPEGLPETWASLSTGAVVGLALALPLPFLAGMVWRTLVLRREPVAFDAVQTTIALLVGLGAAARLAAPAGAIALVWGAAALAAILSTPRVTRELFTAQGAVLLTAAAFESGLLTACLRAFLGPAGTVTPFSLSALLVLALSGLGATVAAGRGRREPFGWAGRLAALALAVLSVLGVAALAEHGLVFLLAAHGDLARTAAIRSAVLAAAALALAACRRVPSLADLSRLAYPLLAAGGLKLLVEDLPHGRPVTLFLAFALYGAVLMAVPRLLRSASTRDEAGRK